MRTSDLLLLIKSLSKAERRNFHLQAMKQDGSEPAYLALYAELENISDKWESGNDVPEVDENVLEENLRQKNVEGPIPAMKNYLSKAIFKSLRQLYEKNSKRSEIEADLRDALILENRGLLGLASGKLNDALHLALKYEYHALAFDILQHLIRIETQADFKSYAESIGKRLEKIAEITGFLDAEARQFIAYFRAFLQFRLGATRETAMPAGKREPQAGRGATAPTFLAKMYRCQLLSMEALLQGNTREAMTRGDELLTLWEEKPDIKNERLGQYIRHFSNYLNFCVAERSFERFEYHLKVLKAMNGKASATLDLEAELVQNILLAEQLLYLNTNRLEEACAVFPGVEEALKKYGAKINRAREITLRYNHIIALFALARYEQALGHCLDLISIRHHAHRHDLQLLGKILEIIIHFELRDHQYLNNLVSKLGRPFQHAKDSRDFERMLLRHLLKLAEIQVQDLDAANERKLNAALFKQFHDDLQAYKSAAPAKLQIGMEEIAIWVESKVQGKSFREILKRKWEKK